MNKAEKVEFVMKTLEELYPGYPNSYSQANIWAHADESFPGNLHTFNIFYNSSTFQIGIIQTSVVSNSYGYGVRFVRDTNTNDTTPPTITGDASLAIQENQTVVSTYSASEDVTWTLSGVDSALFDIDNPTSNGLVSYNSGELTFNPAPDYEVPGDDGANNEYNVSLIATDSAGNVSDAFAVTVTVTDFDDTDPVVSGSSAVSVAENQTAVSTYTANETVTWSLSGTDSGRFIISNAGELTFNPAPDYEVPGDDGANNEYNVSLIATDSAGNVSDAFAVTVTVTDFDDTDPVVSGSSAVSVAENQTAVSTYTANETVDDGNESS